MDPQSPEALEGRLIAQRKIMALMVAAMDDRARADLEEALQDRAVYSGHSEDPGSTEPTPAFAIEAAAAAEYRAMLDDVRRYAPNKGRKG